jgi:hypothetical protein
MEINTKIIIELILITIIYSFMGFGILIILLLFKNRKG